MNPEIINVSINKEKSQLSYPIFVGNNLLLQSGNLLKKYINNKKIIIIYDNYFDQKNSSNKYFEQFIQSIKIETLSINLMKSDKFYGGKIIGAGGGGFFLMVSKDIDQAIRYLKSKKMKF